MAFIDLDNSKKWFPVFMILLVVAQIDLASAAAWPMPLLSLLHLEPATNDLCRGVCAGIGASIDGLVIFQLARIWAKKKLSSQTYMNAKGN